MILGVEKAGTTALLRHLELSPIVYTHKQREMSYFLSEEEYRRGWRYAIEKYFVSADGKFNIAKNVMQINSPEAMTRLRDQCPEAKCIVMLREPAARAYSAYNHAVLRGAESCPTFEEALALEDERFKKDPRPNNPLLYLRNSTYAQKIKMAIDIYGKDHVLVLYHEEYKQDSRLQLVCVEKFIGQRLFNGVELELKDHNRAAKARFPWLAKLLYRFTRSRSPVKRVLRTILPHDRAVNLRHAVLNFNRVEALYQPMADKTRGEIRAKLVADRRQLIDIIGHCPWGRQ